MKRIISLGMLAALCLSGLSGCAGNGTAEMTETVGNTQLKALEQAEKAGLIGKTDNLKPLEKDKNQDPEQASQPQDAAFQIAEPDTQPSAYESAPAEPEPQAAEPEQKTPPDSNVKTQTETGEANPEPEPQPGESDGTAGSAMSEASEHDSEGDDKVITEEEALGSVKEPIDTEQYKIEPVDEYLEISPSDGGEKHRFYVFAVNDENGSEVGKIAVDSETGEKYTYHGEGTIDSYDSFPLYNSNAEARSWEGSYEGPSGLEMTISDVTEENFKFQFPDDVSGTAAISGDTAKSEDGEINFLLADGIITVAGGGFTGNYTASD